MKTVKKRRKQNKTDYAKRIQLLSGGSPRIVFRRSNRYLKSQYVTSKQAQDKIKINLNSNQLLKYGWPSNLKGGLKSTPAAYLLGFLMGKTILKEKLTKPIIDFGMLRMVYKSRTYAFIRGLNDSGIKINCKEEAFPSEDRIIGKHLKKDFSKTFEEIKSKIDKK